MNSKELHDVYAPLWSKVPETRPRPPNRIFWLALGKHNADDDPFEAWEWVPEGADVSLEKEVDNTSAAALCRVAVEDFIESRGVVLYCTGPRGIEPDDRWGSIYIDTFNPDKYRTHTGIRIGPFIGKTKDEALVAAALAVAGAAP